MAGTVTFAFASILLNALLPMEVMPVAFFLYLLVSVLVVYPVAPADHVDGIVVQQFKLAVQFRDVVPRGGSRVEYLVFETAENAQDKPCPL